MRARRGSSGLAGLIAVDKPAGMTSHDVVDHVRRFAGERRVGHAGTLDPAATGLLVVAVGPATRLANYLSGHDKAYDARIQFGSATDTDDAEGEVIRTAEVPERLTDEPVAREALAAMRGEQMQVPPRFSAVRHAGRHAYEVARAGGDPQLAPRKVVVHEATLAGIGADERGETWWDVSFAVSKGTYVRALARDLGERLGTAAHLSRLRRTRSGRLSLASAHTLADVGAACAEGRAESLFCDPVAALALPSCEVPADELDRLRQGQCLDRKSVV